MWHSHHAKAFSKVAGYPDMVSWLDKEQEAPSNIALWGFEKAVYHFKDLFDFLELKEKEGGKLGGKGKGKMKAKNDSSSGSKKKGDKKKKSSK